MKTIHDVVDVATTDAVYRKPDDTGGLAGRWSTQVTAPPPARGAVVAFTFVDDFNPEMEISDLESDRVVA